MEQLVHKYAAKLAGAGLVQPGGVLVGGLDDELVWNRAAPEQGVLEEVFRGLSINSLMLARPAEPYATVMSWLMRRYGSVIEPGDCETRTFLHDLPVAQAFAAQDMVAVLKRRKGVIVPGPDGPGVVAFGTVSPEQAFVTVSSVCFACFVKFFADYLADLKAGRVDEAQRGAFRRAARALGETGADVPGLMEGPFHGESDALLAVAEAGRATVELGLVDSYFGNVSYLLDGVLYISQTGSSLDELEGCIDPVPLDGSSCAGLTASSEFTAHADVLARTGMRAVLHGHPKFAVTLSLDCDEDQCPERGRCHVACPRERRIGDVPVVPGEVGTGPTGLCHTLPPALEGRRGAIVYGHGLFTVGRRDFNEALGAMAEVESMCRREYFGRVAALGG